MKSRTKTTYVTFYTDFYVHPLNFQVSTRGRQNKKTQSLLSCNRKSLRLPDNVPAVHLQFTEYYFPDNPSLSGNTQLYLAAALTVHFRSGRA